MAKKEFVKSFEEACEKLGISNELPVFPERMRDEYTNRYKLETIAEANGGGKDIDWANDSQRKHYPWFRVNKGASGFGLSFFDCGYGYDLTFAALGSRLYFRDKEAAIFMGENCTELYAKVLKPTEMAAMTATQRFAEMKQFLKDEVMAMLEKW